MSKVFAQSFCKVFWINKKERNMGIWRKLFNGSNDSNAGELQLQAAETKRAILDYREEKTHDS